MILPLAVAVLSFLLGATPMAQYVPRRADAELEAFRARTTLEEDRRRP